MTGRHSGATGWPTASSLFIFVQGCITFGVRINVPSEDGELLTIKAAADVLGVSEQTLRRWDRAGKLRPTRHPMNGYRLYRRDVINELKHRMYDRADTRR